MKQELFEPPTRKLALLALFKLLAVTSSVLVSLFTLLFVSGCYDVNPYPRGHHEYRPTLLSFEELRKPIFMDEPHAIQENGKIVLYGNYLLINEPEEGIHVFDNSDPANPIQMGFLSIPGNTDVVVTNDLLYANNYIDLVVLDISDMSDVKDKHRVHDTFAPFYDPESYGVGPEEGVILKVESIWVEEIEK